MDIRRRTYLLSLLSMGEVLYCGTGSVEISGIDITKYLGTHLIYGKSIGNTGQNYNDKCVELIAIVPNSITGTDYCRFTTIMSYYTGNSGIYFNSTGGECYYGISDGILRISFDTNDDKASIVWAIPRTDI